MKQMKRGLCALLLLLLAAGCAAPAPAPTSTPTPTAQVQPTETPGTGAHTAAEEGISTEGLTPLTGEQIKDGVYDITVDSSSSMFSIVSCKLTVEQGNMTAEMTMSGKGYLKLYMGTGEEALAAAETDFIPFEENEQGEHTFTVPVKALNEGIPCAAFSKKKETWYDRTLLFRADALPMDAISEDLYATAESLGLKDGEYEAEVSLEGGSGRASVASPVRLRVEGGKVTATLVWSSSNYDYMKVNGETYEPITLEGGSTFEIPVAAFDWELPVLADTVAMGEPHEIAYTLTFSSTSVQPLK